MNIFVLDANAVKAAQMLCDKHVVSQCKEYAQILSTVNRLHGVISPLQHDHLFKVTHQNHPCVRWAGNSVGNYRWLFTAFRAIVQEYGCRYRKEHACAPLVYLTQEIPRGLGGHSSVASPPPTCMPDIYTAGLPCVGWPEVVNAYREYYIVEKSRFAVWNNNRAAPAWYTDVCGKDLTSPIVP